MKLEERLGPSLKAGRGCTLLHQPPHSGVISVHSIPEKECKDECGTNTRCLTLDKQCDEGVTCLSLTQAWRPPPRNNYAGEKKEGFRGNVKVSAPPGWVGQQPLRSPATLYTWVPQGGGLLGCHSLGSPCPVQSNADDQTEAPESHS